MTAQTDAARRRELLRRAFAPGGTLTPEEAEELRMLSAPASVHPTASAQASEPPSAERHRDLDRHAPTEPGTPGSAHEPNPEAADAARRDAEAGDAEKPDANPGTAVPSASVPRHCRPRWVVPLVAIAALMLGFGLAWLVAPHTLRSVPQMSADQQRIEDELAASDEFDDGSVTFAGEKDGVAVWTATRGAEQCVILIGDDRRRANCAESGNSFSPLGSVVTQLVGEHEGRWTYVTASLTSTLSGDRTVIVSSWDSGEAELNWASQYTEEERALIPDLQDAGFNPMDLSIVGYDEDLPIWGSYADQKCIAVVDPDTSEVLSSCAPHEFPESESSQVTLNIPFRDSIYSVAWSSWRGTTFTIIRPPSSVTGGAACDFDTLTCTSIDDKTGDAG
ncbi:hypothetical protein [Microbacterium suwonense]|uniref:Uncharacterized protein n=1 Tax=Microbacterium suwonense TaxID=683047 RepID=A0ABM8FUB5_9MICO|nr:hypothetical protein [Microbacterium suwonense]BDZ39150.1 hypothetical protein GCM10025863_17640 [Microbacterium suwonense]